MMSRRLPLLSCASGPCPLVLQTLRRVPVMRCPAPTRFERVLGTLLQRSRQNRFRAWPLTWPGPERGLDGPLIFKLVGTATQATQELGGRLKLNNIRPLLIHGTQGRLNAIASVRASPICSPAHLNFVVDLSVWVACGGTHCDTGRSWRRCSPSPGALFLSAP